MARIRTIKPEMWGSEGIGSCSLAARLTFIGLISIADDEGRGHGHPRYLFGQLHAYSPDLDLAALARALAELARVPEGPGQKPLVVFYQSGGSTYYWLPGFLGPNGQKIDHPSPSKLPPPPEKAGDDESLLPFLNKDENARAREGSRGLALEGKGEDRIGQERRGEERLAPSPSDSSPTFMKFPVVGKEKEWGLTEAKAREYREAFPGVDVDQELKALRQWCVDNPTRRKTFRGMPAFLSRNLARKQDRGGSNGRGQAGAARGGVGGGPGGTRVVGAAAPVAGKYAD